MRSHHNSVQVVCLYIAVAEHCVYVTKVPKRTQCTLVCCNKGCGVHSLVRVLMIELRCTEWRM